MVILELRSVHDEHRHSPIAVREQRYAFWGTTCKGEKLATVRLAKHGVGGLVRAVEKFMLGSAAIADPEALVVVSVVVHMRSSAGGQATRPTMPLVTAAQWLPGIVSTFPPLGWLIVGVLGLTLSVYGLEGPMSPGRLPVPHTLQETHASQGVLPLGHPENRANSAPFCPLVLFCFVAAPL